MPTTNDVNAWILSRLFLCLLVFCRTAGFLCLLPLPGIKELPRQIKLYSAVAMAAFIMPLLWLTPMAIPKNILIGAEQLGFELLLGLFFSAILFIFFCCLIMAGDLIGRLSGLSLSTIYDPNFGESIPVLSNFLLMTGLVVFLTAGGLEQLISGFYDTFQEIAPGKGTAILTESRLPLTTLRLSTILAVRISMPTILAALAALLTAGVIGKMVPQINIMLVSFNVNAILLLAVLAVSIGFGLRWFQESLTNILQTVFRL